jgi:hypothetical protein
VRTLLAGACCFTIAASGWLAAMAVVLRRPDYQGIAGLALLFVLQSLLTIGVISTKLGGRVARVVLAAGATGIVAVGGRAIGANVTGPHFEGYAVVIGAVLILQGLVTLWSLITSGRLTPAAELHRFGK